MQCFGNLNYGQNGPNGPSPSQPTTPKSRPTVRRRLAHGSAFTGALVETLVGAFIGDLVDGEIACTGTLVGGEANGARVLGGFVGTFVGYLVGAGITCAGPLVGACVGGEAFGAKVLGDFVGIGKDSPSQTMIPKSRPPVSRRRTHIGALVGAFIGAVGKGRAFTGATVGDWGAFVGVFVRESVGAFVGDFVGAFVGDFVGALVGDFVGALIGPTGSPTTGAVVGGLTGGMLGARLVTIVKLTVKDLPATPRPWREA
jgi:hypothetical protein